MKGKNQFISHHRNGQIASKTTYLWDKGIKKQERYFENGQLKEKWAEKNERLEGDYISYFSNGQLQEKSFYKNGVLHGMQKIFYEDGRAASKKNYLNGFGEGRHIEFHQKARHMKFYETDKLCREVHYLHKNKHGWEIEYFRNGSIHRRKHWKNGKLDGDHELYDGRTRKILYKQGFKNNKRHGLEIHFEKNGEKTTWVWKNDINTGACKYNAKGKAILKAAYPKLKNGSRGVRILAIKKPYRKKSSRFGDVMLVIDVLGWRSPYYYSHYHYYG